MGKIGDNGAYTRLAGWQAWKRDSRRLFLLTQIINNSKFFEDKYGKDHPYHDLCEEVARLKPLLQAINAAIPDDETVPRLTTAREIWDKFAARVTGVNL